MNAPLKFRDLARAINAPAGAALVEKMHREKAQHHARENAGGSLNRREVLAMPSAFTRPERGESMRSYFTRKWQRGGGTLGTLEALNPVYESIRDEFTKENGRLR